MSSRWLMYNYPDGLPYPDEGATRAHFARYRPNDDPSCRSRRARTVPELFTLIEGAAAAGIPVHAAYDPLYGYPVIISIDWPDEQGSLDGSGSSLYRVVIRPVPTSARRVPQQLFPVPHWWSR